jgi:AbrB family looped-hinge helix DNA binding protein
MSWNYCIRGVLEMPELIMVSNKGQITIPIQFREQLKIKPGDKVYCDVREGILVCKKPLDFFALRGCLGKADIPENEEDLFLNAVAKHVMERS